MPDSQKVGSISRLQEPLISVPVVGLFPISNDECNRWLTEWGHKLGPCNRPFRSESWALELDGIPVAVAMTCSIVHGPAAGFQTNECVELARLAASNPWANRVMLRLWREVCARKWQGGWAPKAVVSYSHNGLHKGSLYRTDGWTKVKDNAGSTGNGGNWGRRSKGYANPVVHGLKTLWVYKYPNKVDDNA